MLDLRKFYFDNIKEEEYHYRFFYDVENYIIKYNVFGGYEEIETEHDFQVYDAEEAITKFRELCQPDVNFSDGNNRCWFYSIIYYLYKMGYEIKEFPRVLARPPKEPDEFTYKEIRNTIIAQGNDDNGTVRYATRRQLVNGLTFVQKSNHIDIGDALKQKFMEISNRDATFEDMSIDEKLAEIANLIENMLKRNGKFISLDYSSICFEYISEKMIINYRKKMHCFRHAEEKAIEERNKYTAEQKNFFVDYGLTIVKVINTLVEQELN